MIETVSDLPPVVSVVIPVFNGRGVVEPAIESVLGQRELPWELILVDDGSTDGSADSCRRYAGSDSRVSLIVNGKNRGISKSVNSGVRAARGEFVLVLHQDCRLRGSRWLSNAVKRLSESHADWLIPSPYQDTRQMSGPDKWFSIVRCHFAATEKSPLGQESLTLFSENKADVFRRSTFLERGGFDERFDARGGGEDQEFAARMRAQGAKVVWANDLQFLLTSGKASTLQANLVKEFQYGYAMRGLAMRARSGIVRNSPKGAGLDARLLNRVFGVAWAPASIMLLLASALIRDWYLAASAVLPLAARWLALEVRSIKHRTAYELSSKDLLVIPFAGLMSDVAYLIGLVAPSDTARRSLAGATSGEVSSQALAETTSRSWLRSHWESVVLTAGVVAYVASWSEIDFLRFQSLHAYVWDLGLEMEIVWLVGHGGWSLSTSICEFLWLGFPFIVYWTGMGSSYQILLISQSAALGLAAVPLYLTSVRLLRDKPTSLAIALSYLIFFPLAGVNWYDYHFLAFFPILIFSAYYCFITSRLTLSFLLFFLTGTLQFPYFVYPILFGAVILAESLARRDLRPSRENEFAVALIAASLAMLALAAFVASPALYGPGQIRYLYAPFFSNGYAKVLTVILPLLPLLFLPLFSPRWAVLTVPYVGLAYYTDQWSLIYPYAFLYQYVVVVVPFLYLGTVDAIATRAFGRHPSTPLSELPPLPNSRTRLRIQESRSLGMGILAVTAVTALFFQPFGPFNSALPVNFDSGQNLAGNSAEQSAFNHLLEMVPQNDPYVLFQDDMPSFLPRPVPYSVPLVAGAAPFMCNLSLDNARNGTFPLGENSGAACGFPFVEMVRVDYIIGNLNSQPTLLLGNPTMLEFLQLAYDSGGYGVLGEADGFLLLERGFKGPIQFYEQEAQSFTPGNLFATPTSSTPFSTPSISATNTSGNVGLWNGPYSFLVPGDYSVTFHLKTSNNASTNLALVQILAGPTAQTVLLSQQIDGADFSRPGLYENISFVIYSNSTFDYVQYILRSTEWVGTISLSGVEVTQTQPARPDFVIGITPRDEAFYALLNLTSPTGSLLTQVDFVPAVIGREVWTVANYQAGDEPDFILVDPSLPTFTAPAVSGSNVTLATIVEKLYTSGAYGVAGEDGGLILLEEDYLGSIQLYEPIDQTFTPQDFFATPSSPTPFAGASVSFTNSSGGVSLWNGPYSYLVPGEYAVSYHLATTNSSASNRALIQVLAGPTAQIVVYSENITGADFGLLDSYLNITLTFRVGSILTSVQYIIRSDGWEGTLSFNRLNVDQVD